MRARGCEEPAGSSSCWARLSDQERRELIFWAWGEAVEHRMNERCGYVDGEYDEDAEADLDEGAISRDRVHEMGGVTTGRFAEFWYTRRERLSAGRGRV